MSFGKQDEIQALFPHESNPEVLRGFPVLTGTLNSGKGARKRHICPQGRALLLLRSLDPDQRRAPVKKSRYERCKLLMPAFSSLMEFPSVCEHLADMLP